MTLQVGTDRLFPVILMAMCVAGCASGDKSDAYGQFDAIQTTVSSETGGKLILFDVNEGDYLEAGSQVGLVDTTDLTLKRRELKAQMEASEARLASVDAEMAVRQEQLDIAQTELQRIQSLISDGAATQKQLDDARGKVRTTQKQIQALETQKGSIRAEAQATEVRIEQVMENMKDARINNPVKGTVLTTFAEVHELVQPGQPLYRIAGLDTLELRVYISGAQLSSVKLGQQVQVLVDKNEEENQQLAGTVTWIASEAEFTPRMIQTKEERVTQVYAVKVRVSNQNGILKLGMPGEVNFSRGSSQRNVN